MTTVEKYKYEIDESNAVRVWDLVNIDELNRPFLFQPVNPNGSEWTSFAEAEAWVNAYIQELLTAVPVEEAEEVIEE